MKAAIAAIGDEAWTAINYPHAIGDDQAGCWASEAEITEPEYAAFTSKNGQAVTTRLVVRRVRDQNRKAADQGELSAPALPPGAHQLAVSPWSKPRSNTATAPSSSRC